MELIFAPRNVRPLFALLALLVGCGGGPTNPGIPKVDAASPPPAQHPDAAGSPPSPDARTAPDRPSPPPPDSAVLDTSRPPDAAPPPTNPDAAPSVDAAPPSGDSAALDAACTLMTAGFVNQDPTSAGGRRFAMTIADPQAFIKARAKQVCLILYDDVATMKRVNMITLTIESPGNGVAATGGNRTGFSATYIAGFGGDIAGEINGVVAHEFTHVYQYNRGPGWLIEGMADYVRFKAGFFTLAQRRRGGNFNDAYRTTGFFLAWLDDQYPGFARKMNQAMKVNADETTFMTLTGKPVDTLWTEYQAAIQ